MSIDKVVRLQLEARTKAVVPDACGDSCRWCVKVPFRGYGCLLFDETLERQGSNLMRCESCMGAAVDRTITSTLYDAWIPGENTLSVDVADGKYTFVLPPDDCRVHVLRYGDLWVCIDAGSNAVRALVAELAMERES